MSGVFTGSFRLMTYQNILSEQEAFDVYNTLTLGGGRTCHECLEHCCNNFRLGYAKDHFCGPEWTYSVHTFCIECYGDGPTK